MQSTNPGSGPVSQLHPECSGARIQSVRARAQHLDDIFRPIAAWLVHLFTATGAVLGLFSLYAIHQGQFLAAFWIMGLAIVVDSVDGTFARACHVKEIVKKIDGSLLDNIVDYVNYVIAPAFFILVSDLLPPGWRQFAGGALVLASAYQFSQQDAKTADHFFRGFPSFWNIAVFYLFLWQMSPLTNLIVILTLSLMVFVPIKYIYPTRMEYLSDSATLRKCMLAATLLWGAATLNLLWLYPRADTVSLEISIGYIGLYFILSLYRTFYPLQGSPSGQEPDSAEEAEAQEEALVAL